MYKEKGQSMVEYAVILGVILLVSIMSLKRIGEGVVDRGGKVADFISGGEVEDIDREVEEPDNDEGLELVDDFVVERLSSGLGLEYTGGGDVDRVVIPTHVYEDNVGNLYAPKGRGAPKKGVVYELEDEGVVTDFTEVKSLSSTFKDNKLTGSVKLELAEENGVTDMGRMFYGCSNLDSIDLSSFDTSNVEDMEFMFYKCSNLGSIEGLENFDTSNVTTMRFMFSDCSSLAELDLSNFDTSKVKNMRYMFNECNGLESLDLSNFVTRNVDGMSFMFKGCSGLEMLDLSTFNTSNVVTMRSMFYNCGSLKELDLSSFGTGKVADMGWMFNGCSSLETLDLSSFDTSIVENMDEMFKDCESLVDFKISEDRFELANDRLNITTGAHNSVIEAINRLENR